MAEQLSPEDLQLFYQIALVGRKDLPLAATPRSGLEMVLLRMLAFQPVMGGGGAVATPSIPAKSPPAESPASRARAALAESSSKPTLDRKSEPALTEPVSTAATNTPQATNSTLNANNWEQMVATLGLGGLARQLAQNCLLKEHNGNRVVLEIAAKSSTLLNARCEKQIADALSSQLGGEVKLSIVTAQSTQLDTPAARAEQRADQARTEAVNVIQNDVEFQSLVTTFDGQVVEGSIQAAVKPN